MSNDAQAPLGAELVTPANTSANPNPSSETSTPNQASQPIKLTPDSMVDIDGKPVKFSDHVRGFQSQATKASQRAAELERKLAEREQAIQRYEQQQRQSQTQAQRPGQQADMFAGLRQEPYLTGEMAAGVFQGIVQELNTRDQYIMGILKAVQKLNGIVSGLNENHTNSQFDSKISRWLQEGGYPQEYSDLAKEVYLAYEGTDLDAEFPQIFKNRVEQVEKAWEAKRRQNAEAARRRPFVPGKGGEAQPSAPLKLNVKNSARQDADELWEQLQFGQGT
jgi:hypothetical protein